MPKYLIDINLPAKFSLWHHSDFIKVIEIDQYLPDKQIWEYAKENDLIIVTKDRDFYDKIMISGPPPKVIHIRVGNMKMKVFHSFMNKIWPSASNLIQTHKLVLVDKEKLEGIN